MLRGVVDDGVSVLLQGAVRRQSMHPIGLRHNSHLLDECLFAVLRTPEIFENAYLFVA